MDGVVGVGYGRSKATMMSITPGMGREVSLVDTHAKIKCENIAH